MLGKSGGAAWRLGLLGGDSQAAAGARGCTGEHFAVTAAAAFSRLARLLAIWLVGAFYTRRQPREAQPYANRRREQGCLTPRSTTVMEFKWVARVYVTFRWRRTCSSAPPIQLIIQPAPNPLNALGFLSAQPSKSRRPHPAHPHANLSSGISRVILYTVSDAPRLSHSMISSSIYVYFLD